MRVKNKSIQATKTIRINEHGKCFDVSAQNLAKKNSWSKVGTKPAQIQLSVKQDYDLDKRLEMTLEVIKKYNDLLLSSPTVSIRVNSLVSEKSKDENKTMESVDSSKSYYDLLFEGISNSFDIAGCGVFPYFLKSRGIKLTFSELNKDRIKIAWEKVGNLISSSRDKEFKEHDFIPAKIYGRNARGKEVHKVMMDIKTLEPDLLENLVETIKKISQYKIKFNGGKPTA